MKKLEKTVMAHRYLYYVLFNPTLSDYEYDQLEKKALLKANDDSPLHLPGSDLDSSYSDEIKELALTLT